MQSYVLRDIRPVDAEPLYLLHRAALGDYVEAIYGPWDDRVQRQFHARWLAGTAAQIIDIDDTMAGVLDVETIGVNEITIGRIEIRPERLGQGLGTEVLSDLLDRADAIGAGVALEVIDINPAMALYERLGFRETRRIGRKIHLRRAVGRTCWTPHLFITVTKGWGVSSRSRRPLGVQSAPIRRRDRPARVQLRYL